MPPPKILLLPLFAALAGALFAAAPPVATTPSSAPVPAGGAPTGPSRVTLALPDISLTTAFSEIEKQTGIRLIAPANAPDTPSLAPVSLDVKDRPLWEVLQSLLEQQGQGPAFKFSTLLEGKTVNYAGRFSISGPFLVIATSIRQTIDLHGPDPQHELIVLELQVLCDSKTPMLFTSINDSLPTLEDDTGNHAAPKPRPAAGPTLATPGRLQYAFSRTGEQGKKGRILKSINGTVSAGFVKSTQNFSLLAVDDPPTDIPFHGGELTVSTTVPTSRPPNSDPNTRAVIIKFRSDVLTPQGLTEAQRLLGAATIDFIGSNGTPWRLIQSSGTPVGGPTIPGFTRQLLFSPPLQSQADSGPATISMKIPSELATVDVPFHFESLPLP